VNEIEANSSRPTTQHRYKRPNHHYEGKENNDVSILDMGVMVDASSPKTLQTHEGNGSSFIPKSASRTANRVVWTHNLTHDSSDKEEELNEAVGARKTNMDDALFTSTNKPKSRAAHDSNAIYEIKMSTDLASETQEEWKAPNDEPKIPQTKSSQSSYILTTDPSIIQENAIIPKPKTAPSRLERLATPKQSIRADALARKAARAAAFAAQQAKHGETAPLKVRVSSAFQRLPPAPIVNSATIGPFRPQPRLTVSGSMPNLIGGRAQTAPESMSRSSSLANLTNSEVPQALHPGVHAASFSIRTSSEGNLSQSQQQQPHVVIPSTRAVKVHMQRAHVSGRLRKTSGSQTGLLSQQQASGASVQLQPEVVDAASKKSGASSQTQLPKSNQHILLDSLAKYVLTEQDAARITSAKLGPHSVIRNGSGSKSTRGSGDRRKQNVSFDESIFMSDDRNSFWDELEEGYALSDTSDDDDHRDIEDGMDVSDTEVKAHDFQEEQAITDLDAVEIKSVDSIKNSLHEQCNIAEIKVDPEEEVGNQADDEEEKSEAEELVWKPIQHKHVHHDVSDHLQMYRRLYMLIQDLSSQNLGCTNRYCNQLRFS
jgi:hypothetical protein